MSWFRPTPTVLSPPPPPPPSVSKDILLLGPGTSRHRIPSGSAPFGSRSNEKLTVIDTDPAARKAWPEARVLNVDLRRLPDQIPQLAPDKFSEVHAYELLNLLPGDEVMFFAFWREMWRVLKPGCDVWATVPHWRSQYIHAYPAPQRVYTLEMLAYLDPLVAMTSKSNFGSTLWPAPYRFRLAGAWEISAPKTNEPQGLHFHLVKEDSTK